MQVWSLGWEDPLEEGIATHSRILAWRIPWTEEPRGLLSMGSQRVGHDWSDSAHARIIKWEAQIKHFSALTRHGNCGRCADRVVSWTSCPFLWNTIFTWKNDQKSLVIWIWAPGRHLWKQMKWASDYQENNR